MKTKIQVIIVCIPALWLLLLHAEGQKADTTWTLQTCIQHALQQNIQVRKTTLTTEVNRINADQKKASRFPSVSASVSQNFAWAKTLGSNNAYSSYSGSNSTGYSVSSSVNLYNGFKTRKTIRQAELTYQSGQYDVETQKESISLSVLDAYLQVLYAEEQVKNTEKQVESTTEQLRLAEERMKLGAISRSDYLEVKSELASENLTLANAQSLLVEDRVTLMQLMELPVTSDSFDIDRPDMASLVNKGLHPKPDSVYNIALGIKPQIKSYALSKQVAELDVDVAKAGYQPVLSLSGGVSTGYTSGYSLAYDYQVRNRITPSVGLTLSIPIYQNKEVRSEVAIAKIGVQTAELNETNTKNTLRKNIEQACTDVMSAQKKFESSQESYNSAQESYQVALEKYNVGLINSVDFLIQKTSLITAESELLQAKYNLVFSYKTLDFYSGVSLTL
jgi:outer membrane protein